MAGAVLVPINTRMKGAEAADILERSRAKVLYSIGDFLGQHYPAMLDGLRPPTLETVVVGSGSPRAGEIAWADHLARGDSSHRPRCTSARRQLHADSTADLMFTSGTTGRPKGVMAGHEPTIRAFTEWARVVGLGEGDRYLIINPSSTPSATRRGGSPPSCAGRRSFRIKSSMPTPCWNASSPTASISCPGRPRCS